MTCLRCHASGQQLRDYLPVDDAARYLVVLALNGRDNGVVNVCSGRPVSVRELVEEVVKAHLKPGTQYFAPTPEWDQERSWDRLWS